MPSLASPCSSSSTSMSSRTQAQLKAEAKFNVRTDYPNLSLHTACASGNLGLAKYAITHGQPVNSSLDGVLPLHAACAGGSLEVVRYLVEEAGADVDVDVGRVPRRYGNERRGAGKGVAGKGGREVVVVVGASGSTPLHFAAANGHLSIVKLLLEHGANRGRRDKYGVAPEEVARANGWVECAEVLRGWPLGGLGAGARTGSGVNTADEVFDEMALDEGDEFERDDESERRERELIGYPGFPAGSKRLHVKKSVDTALHLLKASSSSLGSPRSPRGEVSSGQIHTSSMDGMQALITHPETGSMHSLSVSPKPQTQGRSSTSTSTSTSPLGLTPSSPRARKLRRPQSAGTGSASTSTSASSPSPPPSRPPRLRLLSTSTSTSTSTVSPMSISISPNPHFPPSFSSLSSTSVFATNASLSPRSAAFDIRMPEKEKERRLGSKISLRGLFCRNYADGAGVKEEEGEGATLVLTEEPQDTTLSTSATATTTTAALNSNSNLSESPDLTSPTSPKSKSNASKPYPGPLPLSPISINLTDLATLSPMQTSAVELHNALARENVGEGPDGRAVVYVPDEAEAEGRIAGCVYTPVEESEEADGEDGEEDKEEIRIPVTPWTEWTVMSPVSRTRMREREKKPGPSALVTSPVVLTPTSSTIGVLSPKKSIQKLRFEDVADTSRRRNVGLRSSNSIGSFRSYAEMGRKNSQDVLGPMNSKHEDEHEDEKDDSTNILTLPNSSNGSYAKLILERPPHLRSRGQSFASSIVSLSPALLTPDISHTTSASTSTEFPFEMSLSASPNASSLLPATPEHDAERKRSEQRFRGYSVSSSESSAPGPVSPPTRTIDFGPGSSTPPGVLVGDSEPRLKHSASSYLRKNARFMRDADDDDDDEDENEYGDFDDGTSGFAGSSPTYSVLREMYNSASTPARYVSSRAEALALVQRAQQEIIDAASTPVREEAEAKVDSAEANQIPLSAQLAAYGEVLALERRFAKGERQREQWINRSDSEGEDKREVVKTPVSAKSGVGAGSRRFGGMVPPSPRRSIPKASKPRRPHTAEGRTTTISSTFDRLSPNDFYPHRPLHGKSLSATSPVTESTPEPAPSRDEEKVITPSIQIIEISATPRNSSQLSPTSPQTRANPIWRNVNKHTVPSSPRHTSSLDVDPRVQRYPKSNPVPSGLSLSRTITTPATSSQMDVRPTRSTCSEQKLNNIIPADGKPSPAVSQSIASNSSTKHRFGGFKSLVQSLKGR